MPLLCKYYPSKEEETSVCHCNSEVGGLRKCTREYSLSCPWRKEKEEEKERERRESALQQRI